MVRENIRLLDYYRLMKRLRELLIQKTCNLYSVIVYGSVCRLEARAGYSDLDVLVVLKDDYLTPTNADSLYNIAQELMESNIKIHLRIRNLSDLILKTSGLFDCGVTSSINKLRDSITLYGESLDKYYIEYLSSVSIDEIVQNLKYRYSDLRYQCRSLLSMKRSSSCKPGYETEINYKVGCILYQLAELICYSNGILFANSNDAIDKVKSFYDNYLFDLADEIKSMVFNANIPSIVSEIDQIIGVASQNIKEEALLNILQIKIEDNNSFTQSPEFFEWARIATTIGFEPQTLIIKLVRIDSGVLTINRILL